MVKVFRAAVIANLAAGLALLIVPDDIWTGGRIPGSS